MATEVDICNIALSLLGDTATVAGINPPEGSAQAEHRARFYPVARDCVLELYNWSFATRRISLTRLDVTNSQWAFVYAMPPMAQDILAILPPDANNDYNASSASFPNIAGCLYTAVSAPQPFHLESLADGTQVICTDQEGAICRYQAHVTDPSLFSSLFILCVSWYLASLLAGPVIKGDMGRAEAKRCLEMFKINLGAATINDAVQRQVTPEQSVPWLAGR